MCNEKKLSVSAAYMGAQQAETDEHNTHDHDELHKIHGPMSPAVFCSRSMVLAIIKSTAQRGSCSVSNARQTRAEPVV